MSNKTQLKVYLEDEYIERLRQHCERHGIIAPTGRYAGQPYLSEVIRLFIDENTEPLAQPAASTQG